MTLQSAARRVVRHPRLSAIVVVAMAVGISATTVGHSTARGMLGKPPVPDAERVVHVSAETPSGWVRPLADSAAVDLETRPPGSLARVGGYSWSYGWHLVEEGRVTRLVRGPWVTPGLLEAVGVRPRLGRGFSREDLDPETPVPILIGHDLWVEHYRADSSVVGRAVRIDGLDATIQGVMPPGFRFPDDARIWVLGDPDPANPPEGGYRWRIFGRMSEDADLATVEREILTRDSIIVQRMEGDDREGADSVVVEPLTEAIGITPQARRMVGTFVIMGWLVLGAAAGCVAILLLARALSRMSRTVVELTFGAPRRRLIERQLAEVGILAAVGGVAGVGLAYLTLHYLDEAARVQLPYFADLSPDPWIVVIAAGAVVVAALLAGAVPAWRGTRVDLSDALKEFAGRTTSIRMGRVAPWLVIIQVAFSAALLLIAMAMTRRALMGPRSIPAYEAERVMRVSVWLPSWRLEEEEARAELVRRVVGRIRGLPGVAGAGVSYYSTPGAGRPGTLYVAASADGSSERSPAFDSPTVPGLHAALGIEASRGRLLTWDDRFEDVVVLEEALAGELFAD